MIFDLGCAPLLGGYAPLFSGGMRSCPPFYKILAATLYGLACHILVFLFFSIALMFQHPYIFKVAISLKLPL